MIDIGQWRARVGSWNALCGCPSISKISPGRRPSFLMPIVAAVLMMLVLLAGDVELNPGPTKDETILDVLKSFSARIKESLSCPERLADKLWSAGLIVEQTKQSVTQSQGMGVTPYHKASQLVDDFRKVLIESKDKEGTFVQFCEILKDCLAQKQLTLVEEMLREIGKDSMDFETFCGIIRTQCTSADSEQEWPPHIGKKFFGKLTIIETTNKKKYYKIEKQLSRHNEHEILNYENGVDVAKIIEKSVDALRILIIGSAGSGKTTLCQNISLLWAKYELSDEYALVLHCPLRAKKIREAEDIKSLLQYFSKSHSVEQTSKWLSEKEGRGLLILFDGWDEFQNSQQKSFINDIIEMRILGQCDVIITSRRHASYSLVNNPKINKQFEIIGFSDKEIEVCISKTLDDDPLSAQKLIAELGTRPQIKELCHMPLFLSLVIFVFDECDVTLPKTLTNLYEKFVTMIITREFKMRTVSFTIKDLKSFFSTSCEFQEICEFAYKNLCINLNSFSDHEVRDALPHAFDKDLYGLITTYNLHEKKTYEFCHLSIQEFLAAFWVRHANGIAPQLFQEQFNNSRLQMCFQFIAGLTKLNDANLSKYIVKEPSINGGCIRKPLFGFTRFTHPLFHKDRKVHFNFDPKGVDRSHIEDLTNCPVSIDVFHLRMLIEAENNELCKAFADSLSACICTRRFKPNRLTMFDVLCLKHLVCRTSFTWKHLDLRGLGGKQLSLFLEGLSDLKREDQCKLHILELDLYSRKDPVNIESVNEFFSSAVARTMKECYISIRTHSFSELQYHVNMLISLFKLNLNVLHFASVWVIKRNEGAEDMYARLVNLQLQQFLQSAKLKEFHLHILLDVEEPVEPFQLDIFACIRSIFSGMTANKSISSFSIDVVDEKKTFKLPTELNEPVRIFLMSTNTAVESLMIKIDLPDRDLLKLEISEVKLPLKALEVERHPASLKKDLGMHVKNLQYLKQSGLLKESEIGRLFITHSNLQALAVVIDNSDTAGEVFSTLATNQSLKALRIRITRNDVFTENICCLLEEMLLHNESIQFLDIDKSQVSHVHFRYLNHLSSGLQKNNSIKSLRTAVPVKGGFTRDIEHFFSALSETVITEIHLDFRNGNTRIKDTRKSEELSNTLFKDIFSILTQTIEKYGRIKNLRLGWMSLDDRTSFRHKKTFEDFWHTVLTHATLEYISIQYTSEIKKAFQLVQNEGDWNLKSQEYKKIDWFYKMTTSSA